MSSAGQWEIQVSQPYPIWCRLKFGNVEIASFTHKELHDLEYAVKRAILEARNNMPDSHKHELD